jgi:hypothetical protein
MAKLTCVSVNIRRWTNSKDEVLETLILECLPKHYGWEAASKAYYYTQRILKKRWKEGEKVILEHSPHFAYLYAKNIIKGRWIDAEPFIAKDEQSSYYYSKYVLKRRFPQFEANLKEGTLGLGRNYVRYDKLISYARFFLNGRLPRKYERQIAQRGHNSADYAVWVLKKRWKAAEKSIAKSSRRDIDLYIRSLKSVKDRRGFRTLLLAESMSAKSDYVWCPARDWLKENDAHANPVLFN